MRIRSPWFALGFVGAVVIGATIGLTGASPAPTPRPTTGTSPAPSSSFTPAPETEPAAQASASAGPATASPVASDTATHAPVATPGPTLDWVNVGYAVGVRSPVALGGKARVELDAPVGPSCTLTARYPSGGSANVGSPTHPKAGQWIWSWTVPQSAGLGSASIAFGCTYAGLTKPGTDAFQIVAALPTPTPKPTPSPTWSLTGSVAPNPIAAGGTLTFTGHIGGTPPPGIAPIDLNCGFFWTENGYDWPIASDGSVQTRDFTLAGTIPAALGQGSHAWHVTCTATENQGSKTASGTFDVE